MMPVEYEPTPTNVTCRYANGVKLVLDFLTTPFGARPGWILEQARLVLAKACRRREGE